MTLFSEQFLSAKKASRSLLSLSSEEKNEMICVLASALEENISKIVEENKKDITLAESSGLGSLLDRLLLNEDRIKNIAEEVRNVANLQDEVGRILEERTRPNGLHIQQVRVPFGVVGIIYESRPNVTVDAAVLALKSGNAVVLKGGKESRNSNRILVTVLRNALQKSGFSPDLIQFLDTDDRSATAEMLSARGQIDLLIPRGGRGLIDFVRQNARIPVIETGASVVHTFVDESADFAMASSILMNEKMRRTSVCNALDTALIHQDIANDFLPFLAKQIPQELEIHADEKSFSLLQNASLSLLFLAPEDFSTEWLDAKMSLCVVSDLDAALDHIRRFSLGHSESIVTENTKNAERFLREVDSACVYWNASTAFSDGAQFGLGAEIGISTQKMHARGPFALQGLTTTKWVVRGNGQIRPL